MDYAEEAAEYALQDSDLAIKYLAKAIGELQKQVAQQRKPLTREQRMAIVEKVSRGMYERTPHNISIATIHEVEAAHGIKE